MATKRLRNFLSIPSIFAFIYKRYKAQKKFMQGTILADLEDFIANNDHTLTEKDIEKIRFYYGLAVPVIGQFYGELRGYQLSTTDINSLTYLGGTTGLFDDFFDEDHTSKEQLTKMLTHPNLKDAQTPNEKLFLQFYTKALNHPNANWIKEYYLAGMEAQVQSEKQLRPGLTQEEIAKITRQKGGIFILLYRCALEGEISEKEKELLFQIGFLGQLENDTFDIYKDYHGGIHTLATTTKSIAELRATYKSLMSRAFQLIDEMEFSEKNKKKFSRLLAVVATRGLVCLDQLQSLDRGDFDPSAYSKDQLICDMGKTRNALKWINYYLNWDK